MIPTETATCFICPNSTERGAWGLCAACIAEAMRIDGEPAQYRRTAEPRCSECGERPPAKAGKCHRCYRSQGRRNESTEQHEARKRRERDYIRDRRRQAREGIAA